MNDYDYVIIGGGASGLMLASGMAEDPFFKNKSVLILEKDQKNSNDRTWCFWEKNGGTFDRILHKFWPKILFKAAQYQTKTDLNPYNYKMVRSSDFYHHHKTVLSAHNNITYVQDSVTEILEQPNGVEVKTKNKNFKASWVFNSIFKYEPLMAQTRYPVLQQHFVGWFIRTEEAVFDSETATFMDFSIPQAGNTRFMYVLPLSEKDALVEYTLFSEDLLELETYEEAIKIYITRDLKIKDFEIIEREKGNIPMSCYPFHAHNSKRILHIGVSGGWAKASTGYTFKNTHKKVQRLIKYLKTGRELSGFSKRNRFWFYDLLFLDVLHKHNDKGAAIFESLFKKRSPQLVLKFLDEETNLWEEIKVMSACPTKPFILALLKRLF